MSFASSNRTSLLRIKEVTWGLTPANPELIPVRYTGESLDDGITTEKSKEIRSDRMVSDLVITDASITGDINVEFSYASFDDWLESAMMSAWAGAHAIVGVAGDISTTAGGVSSTTAGKFTGIVVGQWLKLSGFTDPDNNIFTRVTAVGPGDALTLSPAPGSVETPALAAAHIDTDGYVRNGVTEQSYTITEIFNDATVVTRRNFYGMRVKGFSFDMKTAALLTGKFSFIGKSAEYTVAAFAGETTGDGSTTDIMNCVTNMQSIFQNGAPLTTEGSVMSLTLELDNQHRPQKGLGVLGNVGVVASQLSVKATASQYFETKDQADIFKNAEAFSFSFVLVDNDGNAYIFTLPRCKYDSFKVNSSQLDSDVMAQTTFQALLDPASDCMVQIDRFDAPV
jgi:hypothetical protein